MQTGRRVARTKKWPPAAFRHARQALGTSSRGHGSRQHLSPGGKQATASQRASASSVLCRRSPAPSQTFTALRRELDSFAGYSPATETARTSAPLLSSRAGGVVGYVFFRPSLKTLTAFLLARLRPSTSAAIHCLGHRLPTEPPTEGLSPRTEEQRESGSFFAIPERGPRSRSEQRGMHPDVLLSAATDQ